MIPVSSLSCKLISVLLLSHLSLSSAKWNYSFSVHLSDSWLDFYGDGSEDSMWWRLCSDTECGIFIHSIWNTEGATYSYTYTTPSYMGPITRIDMAHTGDDMLGLDFVQADGVSYEPGGITGVWSVEYTGGSSTGCDTTTITSDNTWTHGEYDDCIFNHHFHNTYSPTPSPTLPTISPTSNPTINGSDQSIPSELDDDSLVLSYHELIVKDHAINELTHFFESEIIDSVLGTEMPPFNDSLISIGESSIESIAWSQLTITFNPSDSLIMISMQNVSGTNTEMSIKAGFDFLYCSGTSTPIFEGWNMQFGAHLYVINDSCTLGLEFDQNSVVIDHDELDINPTWDDPICGGLYWIFDALIEINDIMVPMMVDMMLPRIVHMMNREMHAMLPRSESVSLDSLGIEETMGICYRNVTIISDAIMIGVDFEFANDSFTDLDSGVEMVAFSIGEFQIDSSNLTEIVLILMFGVLSCWCGCGFAYWRWRVQEKKKGMETTMRHIDHDSGSLSDGSDSRGWDDDGVRYSLK